MARLQFDKSAESGYDGAVTATVMVMAMHVNNSLSCGAAAREPRGNAMSVGWAELNGGSTPAVFDDRNVAADYVVDSSSVADPPAPAGADMNVASSNGFTFVAESAYCIRLNGD